MGNSSSEDFFNWLQRNPPHHRPEENRLIDDPIEYKSSGLTWGTDGLDKNLSPIENNHFILFAGDRGSGKTAFTFFLTMKNVLAGKKIAYFSLEMSKKAIISRLCKASAGITVEEWRTRNIPETKIEAYMNKQKELFENSFGLMIFGKDDMDKTSCENIAERIYGSGCDLAVVDNFNLIDKIDGENELDADKRISKFFMDFTNQIEVPVILIHHLSKNGTVRGSQKIQDNADTVLIGRRNTSEIATDSMKKEFTIFQAKDREFGNFTEQTVYFNKGQFQDEML